MKQKKEQIPSVKSGERVLDLLELLSRNPSIGLTMEQIVQELNIPRSSFYTLSRMLIHRGYIYKPSEGLYKLGIKAFEVGSTYVSNLDIVEVGKAVMQEIKNLTKETVNLVIFDQETLEIIVVAREPGQNAFRFASNVGSRLPAHKTSSGRVFLSQFSNEQIKKMYAENLESDQLERLIAAVGKYPDQGYLEANSEIYTGVLILAVPIYDHMGRMTASMNTGMPVNQIEEGNKERYIALLKQGASYISYLMGYKHPPAINDPVELRLLWEQE